MYGTPVLGSNRGGIPELIQVGKTGDLFEPGNVESLKSKIEEMNVWAGEYSMNCEDIKFDSLDEYCRKLIKIYRGV